ASPPAQLAGRALAVGGIALALVGLHHVADEPAGLLAVADPERGDPFLHQRPQRALIDGPGQVAFAELDLEPQLCDLGGGPLATDLLVLGNRLLKLLAVGADHVEDNGVVYGPDAALGRPPLGDLRLQHADHVGRPLILLADGARQRLGELLLQTQDDLSYRGDRTMSDLSAAGAELLLERLHVEIDDGRD